MRAAVRTWRIGTLSCFGLAVALGCGESTRTSGGAGDGNVAASAGEGGGKGGASGGTAGAQAGAAAAAQAGTASGARSGAGGGSAGVAGESGAHAGGMAGDDTPAGGMSGGGTAGTAAAGQAGTTGDAGAAGEPATGGSQPECQTASDCRMVSDCCGCRAEPIAAPTFCALPCVRDACAEIGVAEDEVECVQGRCVMARSCTGEVGCPALPPNCPDGTVPSVVDDCWGPCLPPTECLSVRDCADCGDAFCVEFQAQVSAFSCVSRVESCELENYCECLGVCGVCSQSDDHVACPCLGC